MNDYKLSRYTNSLKGIFSFLTSSALKRPLIWGMPVSAGIEVTNHCNLACPECASGSGIMKRSRGFMSRELFEKIIEETSSFLTWSNLCFQGEPMMHPEFFSFLEKASGLNLIVSTNGHFLTGGNAEKLASSSLGKLIVSLDGMDKETYLLYRKNGDFEKVKTGIRSLSYAIRDNHSSLKMEIQFLVNRHNESQIGDARRFAEKMNARLRLKSMQIISRGNEDWWMPENEKFRRYKYSEGSYRIKSSYRNMCSRLWFNPVITWDGNIVPCCFDKDAGYVMGNLKNSSFREIWYGEKYMNFRSSLLKGRENIDICRNCTSGLKGVSF